MNEVWKKITAHVARSIPRAHFLTYFQKTDILEYKNGILVVGIPREFFKNWCEQNAKQPILEAAQKIYENCKGVEFQVEGKLEHTSQFDPRKILKEEKTENIIRKLPNKPEIKISTPRGSYISRMTNPDYTLQNFIVGEGNGLAHAAGVVVSQSPGEKYNPLFIHGDVGLGKTHLLQGIANQIGRIHDEKTIVYLTTQNFIDEAVRAYKTGKAEKVREKYSKVDVFILDDIQFLVGREKSQEILFHIFNDLFDQRKQIIFSSDKAPGELSESLESRITSRLTMGMTVEIEAPDYETKIAILNRRMGDSKVLFDPNILEFVADNSHGSIRELNGVFQQMVARFELQGKVPTITSVTDILKKHSREYRKSLDIRDQKASENPETMDEIANTISHYYDVTVEQLKSSSRKKEYVVPRQIAMWFANKKLRIPLQKIGNYFGGRDHTSVLSSVRKVEKDRKTSTEFWRQTNQLRKKLGF